MSIDFVIVNLFCFLHFTQKTNKKSVGTVFAPYSPKPPKRVPTGIHRRQRRLRLYSGFQLRRRTANFIQKRERWEAKECEGESGITEPHMEATIVSHRRRTLPESMLYRPNFAS